MTENGEEEVISYRPSQQVVLEGWLLKKGIRRRGWNNRYFVLCGNELSYFEEQDDVKPKGTFSLADSGCSVSDIYLHQRQKDKSIVYCVKLSWGSEKGVKPDISMDTSITEHIERETPPRLSSSARGRPPVASNSTVKRVRSPSEPRNGNGLVRDGPPDVSLSDSLPSELLAQSLSDNNSRTAATETRPISPTSGASLPKPIPVSRRALSLPPRNSAPRPTTPVMAMSTPPRVPSEHSLADLVVEKNGELVQKDLTTQQVASQTKNQQEQILMHSLYHATKKANKKKRKKKIVKGGKIAAAAGAAVTVGVLTAGVGIAAGLMVLGAGAAAGGTGVAAEQIKRKKGKGGLVIGSTDYEDVKRWKAVLEACVASETVKDSTWGQMFAREGRNTTTIMLPTTPGIATVRSSDSSSPRDEKRRNYRLLDEPTTKRTQPSGSHWRPMEGGWATMLGTGVQGLRIFREEREQEIFTVRKHVQRFVSFESTPCPPLKAQVVLNSSPLNAFMCLLSLNRFPSSAEFETPLSGQRASFRIMESIDDHMDVIHLVFRPLFLFPSWTAPRDFVLFRYWRLQDDGTYLVCYDSVHHRECPPSPGYVRGEMHAVYTIAPRKQVSRKGKGRSDDPPECLMSAVVQVEPRGWVPTKPLPPLGNQGYGEVFAVSTLLQILDIRDALDHDRFVSMGMHHPMFSEEFPLPFSPRTPRPQENRKKVDSAGPEAQLSPVCSVDADSLLDDPDNYDFTYADRESVASSPEGMGIMSTPPPLAKELWCEPDANSFRVRGKSYVKDGKKVNAGSSIGRLIAVDIVQVAKNFYTGFCAHPEERMQLALERDRQRLERGLESELPPFIFCVNICLPGPPCYHGVFYYAIDDMSTIDGSNGTPESKLANEFIFGSCDKMRDNTFKLIPQIVKGNFMVRKAVGSTPAIMGTKLRQLYVRGERFFEVVLDCGSSSVASGVIRLALGYSKTMVIDMGFLLEGYDEATLPEKIMGCIRARALEFGPHLRFVSAPKES